jgi:hypothetical protein
MPTNPPPSRPHGAATAGPAGLARAEVNSKDKTMNPSPPRAPALGFIFVTLVLLVLGFGIIIPVLPGLVTQFKGGSVSEGSHA